ncbi:GntR family transcriptional regulator [Rhodovulum euryhalinum]|uniref:GntR family transcriptional regulator n=1 Tax=Rhodovulum euryhalinum TaxID=35805 RepID=A0A4R2KHU7_9RHOB|nr:GntR family transcriptional regulator [Rhodovulum euryhalinum]TCO71927.1 GntR family transcriptional regulator [Rhodovulum euryhalinum]
MSDPTLPEKIANQLRRDILRGKLPPGAAVKERDNAAGIGVSRTPMREAIRILAKEGLVVLRPARSPVVARPSVTEVRDQVAVLLALERLSAELACTTATEADLARLARRHADIEAAYDHVDALDLFEMDMGFHMMIAEVSHNAALAETHRAFLARLWRARFLSARQRRNRERVVGQHGAIMAALDARDPAAVRLALDAHLGHLADDIVNVLEQEEAAQT